LLLQFRAWFVRAILNRAARRLRTSSEAIRSTLELERELGQVSGLGGWLRACFSCTNRSNCIRFSIAFASWVDVFVISDLAGLGRIQVLCVFGFVGHGDKEYTADGDAAYK